MSITFLQHEPHTYFYLGYNPVYMVHMIISHVLTYKLDLDRTISSVWFVLFHHMPSNSQFNQNKVYILLYYKLQKQVERTESKVMFGTV